MQCILICIAERAGPWNLYIFISVPPYSEILCDKAISERFQSYFRAIFSDFPEIFSFSLVKTSSIDIS
ncbi:hypothetical protein XENTR_v10018795 [Xenopus tropicalis]|nr:hypothetical protein XENTR_v10018795 [Xenopus tropicalis]